MTISIINKDINTFHENGFLLKDPFLVLINVDHLLKNLKIMIKVKLLIQKR